MLCAKSVSGDVTRLVRACWVMWCTFCASGKGGQLAAEGRPTGCVMWCTFCASGKGGQLAA
eukprot:364088-Chlamydomonas_euryale.AAC.1